MVDAFRRRSRPGKNLYLWCGGFGNLLKTLGTEAVEATSILGLPGLKPVPAANEARELLQSSLEAWIQGVAGKHPHFSIAALNEPALLAYYEIGLESIFLHHASDTRMTVVCVEPGPTIAHSLPAQLECDPLAVHRYFRRSIPVTHIIEEE
ncbi:MAG: hypothetical protein HY673_10455 [Chloroflexi bacterium]|nr:hypothetical protein [Chloroflexota bacterium]